MRALVFALPISLALWAGIYAAVHAATPDEYRHAIKSDLHRALAEAKHGFLNDLSPHRFG